MSLMSLFAFEEQVVLGTNSGPFCVGQTRLFCKQTCGNVIVHLSISIGARHIHITLHVFYM